MISMNTKNGYSITQVLSKKSSVFLLRFKHTNILIDSGFKTEGDSLIYNLKTLQLDGIDTLILTHAHHDHAGNAAKVKAHFGCQVMIHKHGAEFLQNGKSPPAIGTSSTIRFLMKLFGGLIQSQLKYEPCSADILVEDEYDLKEAGLDIEILHTPGHTHGSISVVVDNEAAIVGDALYGAPRKTLMPLFAIDTGQITQSWKKLLDTNSSVFIPGHGGSVEASRLQRSCRTLRG
jgi:glyoxylase-like metal-dependent hydrolase (beta-lactamase superfamily II)